MSAAELSLRPPLQLLRMSFCLLLSVGGCSRYGRELSVGRKTEISVRSVRRCYKGNLLALSSQSQRCLSSLETLQSYSHTVHLAWLSWC